MGCSRAHYRLSADNETYPVIAERIVQPAYDIGSVDIEPELVSRLADEFDPDFPPKPPDDPAAAEWMEHPGWMRGAKNWEKDGVTDRIEPIGWELVLEPDERGVVRLDQDKAVDIALLNSREYQTAEENLYLTALRLTLARFQFDLQWFLTNDTTYRHFGSGGSANGETNTLSSLTGFGFRRNLAAGGQLLVDFANSLVYQYTGDGSRRFSSNLLVSLTQPLLRGAGRDIALESLTQTERDVLYEVRDFARFRKRFWADIAVQNGGYLDLLLSVQTVRNNQANLKQQEETYRLYSELFKGGRASAVELDQFFQALQQARLNVITSEAGLQTSLDLFKLRMGLPPRLAIELDESPLDEFVLVDPVLDAYRTEVETFQRQRLAELGEPPSVEALREHFLTLRQFMERLPPHLKAATESLEEWDRKLGDPDASQTSPEQREQAQRTFEVLQRQVPEIETGLKDLLEALDAHRDDVTEENREAAWEVLAEDIQKGLGLIDSVMAIHTQTRIYRIELPPLEVSEEQALAYAQENRLDLQNQLAAITDSWRRVRIAANALQSNLDVVASADLGTDPDHLDPFNFASEASTYTLGLRFDGPLNRQAERNAYRASLIALARAKRDYMALSDEVQREIRNDLRQLRLQQQRFEISRQQLLSAARQLDNARIILLGPRNRRSENDTTTLNLLQALSSLLQARNALADTYITFQQRRVQLLLDLEVLQLDQRGVPTDDPLRLASPLPSEIGPASENIPPGRRLPPPENDNNLPQPLPQP
ncbi:MAG TPA: TolC family protein [Pirellulaceae bacterium]|nr:TolC family protein [Pirellulaceae bacterium]